MTDKQHTCATCAHWHPSKDKPLLIGFCDVVCADTKLGALVAMRTGFRDSCEKWEQPQPVDQIADGREW